MSKPVSVTPERLISPEEWVKKAIKGMDAVGQTNYEYGIQHPKRPIIAASVAAEARYANQVKKAIEGEYRKKALATLTDADVAGPAVNLSDRLPEGYKARQAKLQDRITKLHAQLKTHLDALDKMPTDTDKQREDKVLANLRGLRALHGRVKGYSAGTAGGGGT